jgi:hypothetical protein
MDVHDSDEEGDQAPFLDPNSYYPTMLPFRRVDEPYDKNALAKPSLPEDLAEQEVCHSLCFNAFAVKGSQWHKTNEGIDSISTAAAVLAWRMRMAFIGRMSSMLSTSRRDSNLCATSFQPRS